MAGVSCRASGTGHSLPQPKVGRLLGELPAEAEPCRRMQPEDAGIPVAQSILAQGEGAAALHGSFLGENKRWFSSSAKAVPEPPPGLRLVPHCTASLRVWLSRLLGGKEQGWAEGGWRGGGVAKARSSQGKKNRRNTAPGVRQQRVAREDGCGSATAGGAGAGQRAGLLSLACRD